ncbi:hypothetical protein ACJIZ3_019455 [Penstemon smallii]|uniref:Large ribosomal RNA subunit accumulation protein YCED homolog 2, chloroplastic n=1 Tax=Penstemon smallii TaxID=265156 RepID=A0ABD3T2F7_9LAMI
MAGTGYYRIIPSFLPETKFLSKLTNPHASISIISRASSAKRNHEFPMVPAAAAKKKNTKPRLITISTSDGKWHGNWDCDYTFSLQDLQLHDLLEDVHKDTHVSLTLSIQKHAGLGMSVEGRIITCFTTKCCNCCSPYLRKINTTFKVWVLPSTRQTREDPSHQALPLIGGDDDPSVIYVKPGDEADLGSLIQDTIRLATSVNETCSESCDKSEPKLQYLGTRNAASIEKRWHKLLELKKRQ